jgi:lipoprotein NlpI
MAETSTKAKIISFIIFVVVTIIIKVVVPGVYNGYTVYNDYKDCAAYDTKPANAIKACTDLLRVAHATKNKFAIDQAPYVVLFLHLAHIHAGHDDQQEFERNSLPYLKGNWPAPILALYLGKTTADDVYAKAKPRQVKDDDDQPCEAKFYVGKWYLRNNTKDEAKKAFQSASSTCGADQMEQALARDQLKTLEP